MPQSTLRRPTAPDGAYGACGAGFFFFFSRPHPLSCHPTPTFVPSQGPTFMPPTFVPWPTPTFGVWARRPIYPYDTLILKNRLLGSCATATPPLQLLFVVGCTIVVGITPQPFRLAVSLAKNSKKRAGKQSDRKRCTEDCYLFFCAFVVY